jgi:hypothetical protein
MPKATRYTVTLPGDESIGPASKAVNTRLLSLDLHWNISTGIGETGQNVWNRYYRSRRDRKRKREEWEAKHGKRLESGEVVVTETREADKVSMNILYSNSPLDSLQTVCAFTKQ